MRELPPELLLWKDPPARNEREDDGVALGGPPRLVSFLSRELDPEGADHSLSVVGELAVSSVSPILLLPPPLVEVEPLRLRVDELALMSLSLAFSSKSMNMRDLASLYAASRSSIVLRCFLEFAVEVRPPRLPDSEASTSESSKSSPATEPECDWGLRRS